MREPYEPNGPEIIAGLLFICLLAWGLWVIITETFKTLTGAA